MTQTTGRNTDRIRNDHAPTDGELGYTRFGSPDTFAHLTERFGFEYHGRDRRYPATPFTWVAAPAVIIRTGANPLTGETADGGRTTPGYAATIRIQGYDPDATADVYRAVLDAATHVTEQFTPLTTADGEVVASYGGWA